MSNFEMNEYIMAVYEARRLYPEWRYGQVLFNTLFKLYPDLSEQIRGTQYDPFYYNKFHPRIDAFFTQLEVLTRDHAAP